MNYSKACKVLDIDPSEKVFEELIRKKYKLKALEYHPDKNKCVNAAELFQEVHDSYEFLLQHEGYTDDARTEMNYSSVLYNCLTSLLNGETDNIILCAIFRKITSLCETKALSALEGLEKTMLLKIYNLLCKHRETFHISQEFANKLNDIILSKHSKDECVILNPSLQDLLDSNLYKLSHNNEGFVIPLWHEELVYDTSGGDLIVKCFPTLPNNMHIDEYNNIHLEKVFELSELWNEEILTVDEIPGIRIRVSSLYMKKEQILIFQNMGIPIIDTKHIYNNAKKGFVYIRVKIIS